MRENKDINGVPITIGDTVRRAKWGSDIIPPDMRTQMAKRQVVAIGDGELFVGYILVDGVCGWNQASVFEKVE